MSDRLTPTQIEILGAMRANGGELVRIAGGYWTYPGCPTRVAGGEEIPTRYWGVQSVAALMRLGHVDERARTAGGLLIRVGLAKETVE